CPPEDVHYYLGLAFQTASSSDPLRRAAAIVRFRRFLEGPENTWSRRARAHLQELGPASIQAPDVIVTPFDAPEKDAAVRAVVAAGPELQRCMADNTDGVLRASVRFHPPQKQPQRTVVRPTPASSLRLGGGEGDRVATLAL